MINLTVESILTAQRGLADLHDSIVGFINKYGFDPLPNSIGGKELNDQPILDDLKTAYSQGHFLFESATDHSIALKKLLEGKVPTIAPWTCVRAGLEAAAYSCWLLNPKIDARQRISRSIAFRYEDLTQQVKLACAMCDEKRVAYLKNRIAEQEKESEALGYLAILDKNQKKIGVAERFPRATECIEKELGEEILFRIMSAMAHAKSWALLQLGYHAPKSESPTILRKNLSKPGAVVLLETSAKMISKCVWVRSSLYGHDLEKLSDLLDKGFNKMGFEADHAYWRV
jgi:hypothetical protein